MTAYENDKTYGDGFGAGYAQAVGDADAELQKCGDDFTIRRCRQAILALVRVPFDPQHAIPRPDWTKYRVPAVRDYPTPQRSESVPYDLSKDPTTAGGNGGY